MALAFHPFSVNSGSSKLLERALLRIGYLYLSMSQLQLISLSLHLHYMCSVTPAAYKSRLCADWLSLSLFIALGGYVTAHRLCELCAVFSLLRCYICSITCCSGIRYRLEL